MKYKNISLFFYLIIFTLISLNFKIFSKNKINYYPVDDWRTSTPESHGMDSETLYKMFYHIKDQNMDFHSLLIIRHGYLVTEAYFYPFKKNTLHANNECTNSFISAIIGISIKEGYIKNIYQNIFDFFPDITLKNKDELKKKIIIKHLLTMTSGIDWGPYRGSYTQADINYQLYNAKDRIKFFLDRKMKDKPGTKYLYNNGGVYLLSFINQLATGEKTNIFADKYLFKPMGIKNYIWREDAQGVNPGYYGLFLRPVDMAKFGYLYLKKGNWNGQQIILEYWINDSIKKQTHGEYFGYYGYNWFIDESGFFYAYGYGGQYIIVFPEYDLIIIFTGDIIGKLPLYITKKYILTSIKSNNKLNENPAKLNKLNEILKELIDPESKHVNTLPVKAAEISGKKYKIIPNQLYLKSITIIFNKKNECSLETTYYDSVFDEKNKLVVGLDGKYRKTKTKNSTVFLRGRWINNCTFEVEMYDIFEASQKTKWIAKFDDKKLFISIVNNYGWSMRMEGKLWTIKDSLLNLLY